MSKIGELEEVQNNGEKEYWGNIRTLTHNLKIRLVANKDFGGGAGAPDYLVMCKSVNGTDTQIGSGWLKTPNAPSNIREFLSMTLDDPSFLQPLNVAAFPKEKGKWDISWRRRQNNPAVETA